MPSISNRELVDELRLGNRRGSVHLVEMYQQRLFFECVKVYGIHPLDSEEIVNDVLIAVVRKIGSFSFKRSDSDFHYWVKAILRNRVRDFLRRKVTGVEAFNGQRVEELENHEEILKAAVREFEHSYRELHRENPLLIRVTELLDEMEPWERVLLRCRAQDVPYGDIARYTGKSTDQLKVYHARVKKKFARLFAERNRNDAEQA